MKINHKKIFLISLLLFFFASLVFIKIPSKTRQGNNNKDLSSQKEITIKDKPTIYISTSPSITSGESIFFSFKNIKINDNFYSIKIFINNKADTLFDAIDLGLWFDRNKIEIVEIQNGETFLEYPRKTVGENNLIITGIASMKNGQINYASASSLFANIIVKKISTENRLGLGLDKQNTGIYFSGKNIADFNKSFNLIDL
jgi:hypothetical protein